MEFNKFLAREKASSSSAPPHLHSSSQAFKAGYLSTDPRRASDYLSNTSYLRELEMQQKWEQMVAAEVRRRVQSEVLHIEEEIRRERGGEEEQMVADEVRQRVQSEALHIETEVRREVARDEAIGRDMEAKEAIEREMALRGANTLNIPILSVPSMMMNQGLSVCNQFKGKLVDDVPLTRKPEDIASDVNTSPEPTVDGNILERKRKAPANIEEKNVSVSSSSGDISVNHPSECVNCKVGFLYMEHMEAHLKGEDHIAKVLKDSS